MKNRIGLFLVGCILGTFSSCLGSDDPVGVEVDKNCQISAFALKSDSVPELVGVKFTIDQVAGRIYNADSLPFGTEVGKLICTVTYMNQYAISTNKVTQTALDTETIEWNGTDSLDFSQPVKFEVIAYDGVTAKTYIAQVNVHQQVPELMEWSLYASQLAGIQLKEQRVITHLYEGVQSYFMYAAPADNSNYRLYRSATTDAKSWTEIPLTGLPVGAVLLSQITEYNGHLYLPSTTGVLYQSTDGQAWTAATAPTVKYLLGAVKIGQGQPAMMAGIVDQAGVLTFAAMNTAQEWSMGGAVPSLFPVKGFGNVDYNSMYHEYLMVAGGRDKDGQLIGSAWATMDGKSWAVLTDDERVNFGKREGVMLTKYDEKYFLIGGLTEDGLGSKDIYTSTDRGVNWALQDSMVAFPDSYAGRGFASVQVDNDQFMLIFGGKTSAGQNELNEVWRGRINRLGFQ